MAERSKLPQVWGRRTAAFFAELANEMVLVAVCNDKVFKGRLVGVDVYDIIEYLEEDEKNAENVQRIKNYLAVNGAKA